MVKRPEDYLNDEKLRTMADTWLDMVSQLTGRRSHLRLDPDRCALLVVDAISYFMDPSGAAWLPASGPIRSRMETLLDCWRSFGGKVVFTRHCHAPDDDGGMLGRFWSSLIRCDDPDSSIIFSPLPGESVIRKTTYDSFYGTGLEVMLRECGITQILITGVLTHLCCETTARSAFIRGFEVFAVVDAMASSSEVLHRGSVLSMADGIGVMMSTDSVLGICGK